jgi:hypothetical protein
MYQNSRKDAKKLSLRGLFHLNFGAKKMILVKNDSTKVWNASVFHFSFVLFSLKQLKEWTRVKSLSHVDEW